MKHGWWVVVGVLLCWVTLASAQSSERACSSVRINNKGTAGAAITVDATATGVIIAEQNSNRCALTIINEGTQGMRCAPNTGKYPLTVTASVGAYMPAGVYPVFGWAAQEQWKCIRTGGTSAAITVLEELP